MLSDLCPDEWKGRFFPDEGRGLNAELGALVGKLARQPLLVIHADLPLLALEDIAALLTEAESGCAIAPDREGGGTNAIALRDPTGFEFAFGPRSFARHLAAGGVGARVVRRTGLAMDIDTPDDLDAATGLGYDLAVGN